MEIEAREDGAEIIVSVRNGGSYIGPEDRARIFERFYRSPEVKHRAAGTGLGLSVAKKAAEAHGGRVWLASAGTATTFYLAVPKNCRGDRT